MWPDQVSNLGPLAFEIDVLLTVLMCRKYPQLNCLYETVYPDVLKYWDT